MKRRVLHRWAMWLLPLLLVRALVPVGFMLSAHGGELSVVFCSGTLASATQELSQRSAQQQAHHGAHPQAHQSEHHHHSGGPEHIGNSSAPESGDANSCPFALAGSAPGQEIAFFVGEFSSPNHDEIFDAASFASAGPHRADRIRGPPVLI